jgi:hypothetical protein
VEVDTTDAATLAPIAQTVSMTCEAKFAICTLQRFTTQTLERVFFSFLSIAFSLKIRSQGSERLKEGQSGLVQPPDRTDSNPEVEDVKQDYT